MFLLYLSKIIEVSSVFFFSFTYPDSEINISRLLFQTSRTSEIGFFSASTCVTTYPRYQPARRRVILAYSSRDFNVPCGRETAMVGQLWLLYVLDPNPACFVAFITVMPLMRQQRVAV